MLVTTCGLTPRGASGWVSAGHLTCPQFTDGVARCSKPDVTDVTDVTVIGVFLAGGAGQPGRADVRQRVAPAGEAGVAAASPAGPPVVDTPPLSGCHLGDTAHPARSHRLQAGWLQWVASNTPLVRLHMLCWKTGGRFIKA